MQHPQKNDTDMVLPQTGKIVLGTLLLIISVGVMSLLGVFA